MKKNKFFSVWGGGHFFLFYQNLFSDNDDLKKRINFFYYYSFMLIFGFGGCRWKLRCEILFWTCKQQHSSWFCLFLVCLKISNFYKNVSSYSKRFLSQIQFDIFSICRSLSVIGSFRYNIKYSRCSSLFSFYKYHFRALRSDWFLNIPEYFSFYFLVRVLVLNHTIC